MVSALNDERAIINTLDEGQGIHCILISKILAYYYEDDDVTHFSVEFLQLFD